MKALNFVTLNGAWLLEDLNQPIRSLSTELAQSVRVSSKILHYMFL